MYVRLSKNTFVRQYGPFTYVLNRLKAFDQMFINAEVFMRWITREPILISEVLDNVSMFYCDIDRQIIATDFHDFISPLINEKLVLCGSTPLELDMSDESFSYDVKDPKTVDTHHISPRDISCETIPQDILDKYFSEHPTIFDLQMDITQACTERCRHCYIPEYNPVFLPYVNIVKVIDEFAMQGGLGLSLSGGECMMHPEFDEIIHYARSMDLCVSILSNLTLCTDEKIRLLRETDATVQVSLYSMNPSTHDAITRREGSFVATKTAIEKLRKAHVPCRISCPTMKLNYRDYLDVLSYARSLKMDAQTDFIIMGKMNGDTSNLTCRLSLEETRRVIEDIVFKSLPVNNEYFDPMKKETMPTDVTWGEKKVCGACVSSVCLDADGFYYPCPAFGGAKLGNCYEHSLKWVWNESPETLRIRAVVGKDFPDCLKCKDRDYCSVCMCRNFNETGDMFKPAEHFCKVAAINHEVVDEKQRQVIEAAARK